VERVVLNALATECALRRLILAPLAIVLPSSSEKPIPHLAHADRTRWLALVERVVLNALPTVAAALPPDISAFGDCSAIVFGEADPP
jgi:hypothetical protein